MRKTSSLNFVSAVLLFALLVSVIVGNSVWYRTYRQIQTVAEETVNSIGYCSVRPEKFETPVGEFWVKCDFSRFSVDDVGRKRITAWIPNSDNPNGDTFALLLAERPIELN